MPCLRSLRCRVGQLNGADLASLLARLPQLESFCAPQLALPSLDEQKRTLAEVKSDTTPRPHRTVSRRV
jgi:hypothetical protein